MDVTLATATVASESMEIDMVLVVAVQGSRELVAGLPGSGRDWGRANRPWGRGKSSCSIHKDDKLMRDIL